MRQVRQVQLVQRARHVRQLFGWQLWARLLFVRLLWLLPRLVGVVRW